MDSGLLNAIFDKTVLFWGIFGPLSHLGLDINVENSLIFFEALDRILPLNTTSRLLLEPDLLITGTLWN